MNIETTKAVCFATLTLIAGAVSLVPGESSGNPSDEEHAVTIEGTTVKFVGKVSEKNVERFMNMVQGRNLTTLVISSGGGEINAGMRMGYWVFNNRIGRLARALAKGKLEVGLSSVRQHMKEEGENLKRIVEERDSQNKQVDATR